MILTPQQAVDACWQAGFRPDKGIVIMPCIGWAESRLRTDARHTNADGSVDRGWLQINDRAHPGVSDAEADDPVQAAIAAWGISSQGTKFSPWSAYTSGAYRGPEQLTWMLFQEARYRYQLNLLTLSKQVELDAVKSDLDAAKSDLAASAATLTTTLAALDTATGKIEAARSALA